MEFAPKQWWVTTRDFFRDTRAEMKKVSWPSRPEVIGTTGVVLGAVVFFGLYLYLCDLAFSEGVVWLIETAGGKS